jgi:hypothetical protein
MKDNYIVNDSFEIASRVVRKIITEKYDDALLVSWITDAMESYAKINKTGLENKIKWISVKDQLPEPLKEVLVCLQYGEGRKEIKISYYHPRVECFDHFMENLITHWMPLPETVDVFNQ